MKLKAVKKELMKDPKFRKEFKTHDVAFNISNMICEARIENGWTQQKLAKKMGVQQSAIARAESGYSPTTKFLMRLAEALGRKLIIKLSNIKN